jgi:hypothetical protein
VLNAGQLPDAVHQIGRERLGGGAGVAREPEIERCELDTVRIESELDRTALAQRTHEQGRAHDEQQADRHLPDDEGMPEPQPIRWPLRFVLQRGDDVRPRGMKRRHETRQHRRNERQDGREDDDMAIEWQRHIDWQGSAGSSDTSSVVIMRASRRAADAAGREQQRRFREQLTHEPPASGAHGQAHGDLAASRRRSREEHAGDVCAGDDQDERHDPHQQREKGGHRQDVPGNRCRRDEPQALAAILNGILPFERAADRIDLRCCLRARHARFESSAHERPHHFALGEQRRRPMPMGSQTSVSRMLVP